MYTLVVSSLSVYNLCRYIKSKIFLTATLWRINERRTSGAVLPVPVNLGVAAVREKRYGFLYTV